MLLQNVDGNLDNFRYERYLDDYVAFTRTETEAEEFLQTLERALREFGLRLNGSKTVVEELPLPDEPGWVRELRRSPNLRPSELLDRAIDLSLKDPAASAIQWTLSRIRREFGDYSAPEQRELIARLSELAFTHPHTTPVLVDAIEVANGEISETDINTLLQKHARDLQSSALCWLLHLAWSRDLSINEESWKSIVAAKDPLPIAYLLRLPEWPRNGGRQKALTTALAGEPSDDYTKDENWPGRYIAFLNGRDDVADPAFAEMAESGVQLLRDPREQPMEAAEDPVASASATHLDENGQFDLAETWTGLTLSG